MSKKIQTHFLRKYKITTNETSSPFYIGEIQATDIDKFAQKAINTFEQDSYTVTVFIESNRKVYHQDPVNLTKVLFLSVKVFLSVCVE